LYSQYQNCGDEIYYVDPAQADPPTRTERFGYTIDLGLNLKVHNLLLNFINYTFTAEADDILISRDQYDWEYENSFANIDLASNLISLKGDGQVVVHKGHIIRFLDSFIYTLGNYRGRRYEGSIKSDGFGFSSKGIFNLLNSQFENVIIDYITKHFTIEYFSSDMDLGMNEPINFKSFSLHFRGFEI